MKRRVPSELRDALNAVENAHRCTTCGKRRNVRVLDLRTRRREPVSIAEHCDCEGGPAFTLRERGGAS